MKWEIVKFEKQNKWKVLKKKLNPKILKLDTVMNIQKMV